MKKLPIESIPSPSKYLNSVAKTMWFCWHLLSMMMWLIIENFCFIKLIIIILTVTVETKKIWYWVQFAELTSCRNNKIEIQMLWYALVDLHIDEHWHLIYLKFLSNLMTRHKWYRNINKDHSIFQTNNHLTNWYEIIGAFDDTFWLFV